MNTILWITQLSLAGVFLATGSLKLFLSRQQLIALMGDWPEAFTQRFIKFLATCEILGAVGLVVPLWLDIVPILTPLAATGLAVVMTGAIATHAKRREVLNILIAVVVLVATVGVAVGRFS